MMDTTREYRKEKGKWGTKNMTFSGTIVIVILFLLGASTLTAGCIKNAQHLIRDEGSTADMDPGVSGTAIPDITATTPAPHQITEITPAKSEIVSEVTPFTTPDPYPIIYGTQINSTPQYAFQYRQPEFTKTYSLTGNAYGLLVNVVQGPLYIRYTIEPKYDCLKDPDSCRGTILVPVNRPYMTITIRDNQTQQIVAQDGYGGEYSSDIGHYHFYGTVTSDDSSETQPYNSYPGPRYIPVYKEGQFQVTIEGNYLDTTVGIITGTSPDPLDATEKSSAGTTTTTADDDEDW